MESYIEFIIPCNAASKELLIAELAELEFEGFVEDEHGFTAFIRKDLFNRDVFESVLLKYGVNPESIPGQVIENQNWNAQWEAGYEPIMIEDHILVRAPFHAVNEAYKFELIIKPKNTFGTGHHETTQLVLSMMLKEEFSGKKVLDYGCGTGVLGIMAEKSGATDILGIDIDEWCLDNVDENLALNNAVNFRFIHGTLDHVTEADFDLILANINKNILLESMPKLSALLKSGGAILMSGFYSSDLPDLEKAANQNGLTLGTSNTLNNWCAAQLLKSTT